MKKPLGAAPIAAMFAAGLSDEILIAAVRAGVAARLNATAFDPPTAGGFDQWRHGVRVLRERLVPLGWVANDDKNFCTAVTPCGGHQIAIMGGNAAVGDLTAQPETLRARGDATAFAVHANNRELWPGLATPAANCSTWCLLIHLDRARRTVRSELSLPDRMTESGFLVNFSYRHLLPGLELDAITVAQPSSDSGQIDVVVALK